MKITFVLPGLIGLSGGSRVVLEYANRLKDRGHEVCVVYPLLPIDIVHEPIVTTLRKDLGAVKHIFNKYPLKWFSLKAKLIRVPSLNIGAMRFVEHMIPDADVIVATAWETAYAVSMLDDRKGKKFYFIQHYEAWGIWDDEDCWAEAEKIKKGDNDLCIAMADVTPKNDHLNKYKEAVDRTFKFPMVKITISSWLKRLIEEKFDGSVEGPIVNGINFETFYVDTDKKNDRISVLMPYRPYKNKGTEDGLKAFQIVKEKHPDVEFILFGQKRPPDLPDWMTFLENVSDDGLRKLYSNADIFVCPSWIEGSQLPPMEASACGCAVVATNVGGVPDYAVDGKTILSTPPRDPRSLADAIIRLIENEAERKSIAKNGNEYMKRYTWDMATNRFENILLGNV